MGNSASLQQPHNDDTSRSLPDDLFELTDRQLNVLWRHNPLDITEIQQAARWCESSQEEGEQGVFYITETATTKKHPESSPPESILAVRLCQTLNELALLRFRLVPSRLKEDAFWIATLALLGERLFEYNHDVEGDAGAGDTGATTTSEKTMTKKQTSRSNATNGHNGGATSSNSNDLLLARQVKNQKLQIAKLKRQVKSLEEALAAAASSSSKDSSPKQHKGKWVVHSDSKEFLQYPDEVKQNLRQEKQRRLQQIKDEMKFILDSDGVEHTLGEWSCCKAQTYHAPCASKR